MQGVLVIKEKVLNAPIQSGVYKMFNKSNLLIYVGKAKNIKNRLNSYTKPDASPKTQALVCLVANVEFEITQNERQALILEASLIKQHQPKFNILLKDDKSRVYIKLSNHEFPSISTYRGRFERRSRLFGPFGYVQGSAMSVSYVVKSIMVFVSKVFGVRSCKDTKFKIHKSMGKPCMEFQIGTCCAPCVGYVSKVEYAKRVNRSISFLQGGYLDFAKEMKKKIVFYAQNNEFVEAQGLKNQLMAIENLRLKLDVNFHKHENLDVIALADSLKCVEVFSVRNGYALGGNVFDINKTELLPEEILENFIIQYYSLNNLPPKEIFVNQKVNVKNVKAVLMEFYNITCKVSFPQKGEKRQMVDFVIANLEYQSKKQTEDENIFANGMQMLQKEMGIKNVPLRVEVYDNSHTGGTFFVGSFIVFNEKGFVRGEYRKFNAKFTKGGDDYGMMREVMLRRFREGSSIQAKPDLLIIDGGAGQFNVVKKVLDEMNVEVDVISIAKGEDRNAGNETFFTKDKRNFKIENIKLLHFLQVVRDEAHRFAILSHRKRRDKIS